MFRLKIAKLELNKFVHEASIYSKPPLCPRPPKGRGDRGGVPLGPAGPESSGDCSKTKRSVRTRSEARPALLLNLTCSYGPIK